MNDGQTISPLRKIPTSNHVFEENGATVVMPFLRPTDVLKYFLTLEPWMLFGGLDRGPAAHELLATFWRVYRLEHPSHEVFQMAARGEVQLDHTIPLFLHGDAGRTLKKQPLEVLSLRAALGIDTDKGVMPCSCNNGTHYCGRDKSDPMAQRLNSKNSSYLTHMLLVAFNSKKYKSTPGLLHGMIDVVAKDLKDACCQGISIEGEVYHCAILGMAGDMEYHAKTGFLNRSYKNVGHANFIACCHECDAGLMGFPFEDTSSNPAWMRTLYSTPPWFSPPPFKHIPFENWNNGGAGRFFKRDPFHIFRLGIARNFIGSSIVFLCLEQVFDSDNDSVAIDNRLVRAWSS